MAASTYIRNSIKPSTNPFTLPGKLALQGTQRGASSGGGVTGDQIGNRLGLGQVEFIVEKGTFGKFAGPGWPRTEFHTPRQQ
jgi:hypothetical protein